jgi:hypothetical protein
MTEDGAVVAGKVMPTYEEAEAAAREGAAFSDSDRGYAWIEMTCGHCVHDVTLGQGGPGCPLVELALLGRTPAQWKGSQYDPYGYVCELFEEAAGGR